LGTLKQGGTLVHFGGILGTDTLVVIAVALSWLFFLGAALILVRAATLRVSVAWLRRSLKVLLWAGTTAALLLFGLFGAWTALTADFAYHGASSPDGRQNLLIVNSSVLLLGSFEVYVPSCGPALERLAHLATNNGYDPFAAGQYSVQWSADSATVSYVYDYMHPDTRETVTVPWNAQEECA
jgi:hypothetical protein